MKRARRSVWEGSDVERPDRLPLDPALDRQQPAVGDQLAESLDQGGGLGLGVAGGVEELERGGQLDRLTSVVDLLDRGKAIPGRAREPGMLGDGRIVGGDAVSGSGDIGRDLQRRARRVGLRPERRAAGGVGDRERERESSVGEGDRQQPVAELDRFLGGGIGVR
jgi:hypothetical protein